MINITNLFSPVAKPTKVGGLHGGRAWRLVNSKGIMEVTVGRGLKKAHRRMSADRSGQILFGRDERGSGRAAGCAQWATVGRRPVDEKIRGRIQQESAGRGWCPKEGVGRLGGKVGRPGGPDARDERERGLRRSGRTGGKERTGFFWTRA